MDAQRSALRHSFASPGRTGRPRGTLISPEFPSAQWVPSVLSIPLVRLVRVVQLVRVVRMVLEG